MSVNNYGIQINTSGQQIVGALNNLTAIIAPTASDDNTLGYGVGSIWIDVTGDTIYQCVDASTGAAIWQDLTTTGVDPPIKVLSTTTGIDCTATGQTLLYTVPAATNVYVTQAIVRLTTITGGTGTGTFPIVSIGIGGTFDNIFADQKLTGLNTTAEFWHFNTSGVSAVGVATNAIEFNVDTAGNGTAYDVTVILLGYSV